MREKKLCVLSISQNKNWAFETNQILLVTNEELFLDICSIN